MIIEIKIVGIFTGYFYVCKACLSIKQKYIEIRILKHYNKCSNIQMYGGLNMSLNNNKKTDPFVCKEWFCDEEKVRQILEELDSVEGMALILKALADDTRIKIAYALSKTEMCVCDVARLIGASSNVASYHLRTLNYLGIAKNRKEGKLVYYFITNESIKRLIWDVFEYAQDRKK